MHLSDVDFQNVIEHTPLFSIDIVVVDESEHLLFGRRLNAPAKGFWFVPGGRIRKNETLDNAFLRISKNELGIELQRSEGRLIGLYEHFYPDSFFSAQQSTHYINVCYLVKERINQFLLPKVQHDQYSWIHLDGVEQETNVHPFSKLFIKDLRALL